MSLESAVIGGLVGGGVGGVVAGVIAVLGTARVRARQLADLADLVDRWGHQLAASGTRIEQAIDVDGAALDPEVIRAVHRLDWLREHGADNLERRRADDRLEVRDDPLQAAEGGLEGDDTP